MLLWLSLSSTPVSVAGALSIAALAVCGWQRLRLWSAWLAAPAAVAVGMTAPHREVWVPWLVAAFVWCAALSTARLDDELRGTGLVPVLFAVTSAAAYMCLADSEQSLPLVVVAVVAAVVAVAEPRVSFGGPGSMALIGLLGWIAAAGGIGRPAGTIGALGALGVLVFAGRLTLGSDGLVLATQCGNALVCSRVAGVSHDELFAVVVVALALSATVVVLTWSTP